MTGKFVAENIVGIDEIKQLNYEPYPFLKIREFIYRNSYQENASQLFADLLPMCEGIQNHNLDGAELLQLMKSFEVRTRWRRRRKGKMTTRECYSDGERFSLLSDKELTDSESVSGARVIGFDIDHDK